MKDGKTIGPLPEPLQNDDDVTFTGTVSANSPI